MIYQISVKIYIQLFSLYTLDFSHTIILFFFFFPDDGEVSLLYSRHEVSTFNIFFHLYCRVTGKHGLRQKLPPKQRPRHTNPLAHKVDHSVIHVCWHLEITKTVKIPVSKIIGIIHMKGMACHNILAAFLQVSHISCCYWYTSKHFSFWVDVLAKCLTSSCMLSDPSVLV